uniref:SGNH hydrolase-type esterase domain-containing protein n=1 Tax=Oryzias latipes TaxID=8090 RepID=A0A3P9LAJ1_ORYLA
MVTLVDLNIRFINAVTRCFPGAEVMDILQKLPDLLLSLPSTIIRILVHVGTNDTTLQQSEVTKRDFLDLFHFLKNTGKTVFISGPIPTLSRGSTRFSRILSLNTWLQFITPVVRVKYVQHKRLSALICLLSCWTGQVKKK